MTRKKQTRAKVCKDTPNRSLILKQQRLRDQKSAVLWTVLHNYRKNAISYDELRDKLRVLAYEVHGFVSSELRRQIWPLLLGHDDPLPKHTYCKYQPHRDEEQLQKDIDRSLWNYTSTKLMKSRERNQKRRTLQRIILAVLQGDPDLYYYQVARLMAGSDCTQVYNLVAQGYHDVAAVFLLALEDNDLAVQLLQKATSTYFRPCMRSNFDSVLCTVRLLFVLIQLQDNDLYQHLRQSKVEPYFAFAWFITWFAHHVGGLDDASRLFDVFLCSHPLFSLYVSGAIVLASRSIILKQECEFGTMHDTLSKLVNDVSWDQAIVDGLQLIERFSPGVLLTHATDQHISISSHHFDDQYSNVESDRLMSQYFGRNSARYHVSKRDAAKNRYPLTVLKERPLVHAIVVSGAILVFSYAIGVYLSL